MRSVLDAGAVDMALSMHIVELIIIALIYHLVIARETREAFGTDESDTRPLPNFQGSLLTVDDRARRPSRADVWFCPDPNR